MWVAKPPSCDIFLHWGGGQKITTWLLIFSSAFVTKTQPKIFGRSPKIENHIIVLDSCRPSETELFISGCGWPLSVAKTVGVSIANGMSLYMSRALHKIGTPHPQSE